jgi:SAM-dependent methyltransferase
MKDEMTKYTERRSRQWDTIAPFYARKGLNSGYHDRLIELFRDIIPENLSIIEIGSGCGNLLASLNPCRAVGIDFSAEMTRVAQLSHPEIQFIQADAHDLDGISGVFEIIILSDLLNDLWDVQRVLEQIHRFCTPSTRIVCNIYSHLWALPLRFAQIVGLATPMLPQNWLTVEDMSGLLRLAGFDVVNHRIEILCPLNVPIIGSLCNRYLAKFFPFNLFDLTHILVARPMKAVPTIDCLPSVSIIVPARNEAGNIAKILRAIPQMGSMTEVVFVEGGSSDDTFETIEREILRCHNIKCQLWRQTGVGKGDAVRLGFEKASGDILMILDADITVPPDDLAKFFKALVDGHGEFINGVRLVYPMHDKAMRFLNLIGNKFFSKAFSWLLGQAIKDTLCGTKALWKRDYLRISSQREYFGNFDPFGDFDLIFGAARLNLKIIDLPVRYGERTYGTTNINRWSHGLLLLQMLIFAANKIKFK